MKLNWTNLYTGCFRDPWPGYLVYTGCSNVFNYRHRFREQHRISTYACGIEKKCYNCSEHATKKTENKKTVHAVSRKALSGTFLSRNFSPLLAKRTCS